MYSLNDCVHDCSTSSERLDPRDDVVALHEDAALDAEAGEQTTSGGWLIYRAAEAAAFVSQYPKERRVSGIGEWPIWRDDGSLAPFMMAWLDRNCPGWGMLSSAHRPYSMEGSVFGFEHEAHVMMFDVALSILDVRREYLGRHDAWAAQERFMRSCDLDQFRWRFPQPRRLLADHNWSIWSSGMPSLREPVVRWLNEACPGWRHMPGTYYIGFASVTDAGAFEKEWR